MKQSVQTEDGYIIYTSVDCVDLQIFEPEPFNPAWFSSEINGAAVRYEVCVSLDGDIVWTKSPRKAGELQDLSIFRSELKLKLSDGEIVIADSAYLDTSCV